MVGRETDVGVPDTGEDSEDVEAVEYCRPRRNGGGV
jgi:hypothetical protein